MKGIGTTLDASKRTDINLGMLACTSSSIGFLSYNDHYEFNDLILSFGSTAFREVQISAGETQSRHKHVSRSRNWSFDLRFGQNCTSSTKNWCQNFKIYHLRAKNSIFTVQNVHCSVQCSKQSKHIECTS